MSFPRRPAPLLLALTLTLSLSGCDFVNKLTGQPEQKAPAAAQPPTKVTVMTVKVEPTPLTTELPGRTEAHLIAEVRPQVTGIIKERRFQEGTEVKAGQVLYLIDPASYQAGFDSAQAGLERAEANLHAAKLKARRYTDLAKTKAVSQQDFDEADAGLKQAEAELASAKAALAEARINLNYTEVKSPITGRIGRSNVTAGALVTTNQPAALATVQQLDPIYADFTQSSAQILRIRRDLEAGRLHRDGDNRIPVKLILEDGTEYSEEGELAFTEVAVDEATGSVTLRTRFPNPKGELLPGMYVRAKVTLGVRNDAILVPHAAVSRNPKGDAQVMVVDGEGKVELRQITATRSLADKWVVTDGLKPGERIITEGLQKAKPGSQVAPEEAGAEKP